MSWQQIFRTDDDWARLGYVLVTIRDRYGPDDPIYVRRKFRGPVITRREWDYLTQQARRQHLRNIERRRRAETENYRINAQALAPYRAYREEQLRLQRRRDIEEGRLPLDQMTFFDLAGIDPTT